MLIKDLSSVNLRRRRRGCSLVLDNPFEFCCSVCGIKKVLGLSGNKRSRKRTSVFVKLSLSEDGLDEQVYFCDFCIDVLVDLFVYGPRVIDELYRWKLHSCVARVSLVSDQLFCFSCLSVASSHIFVKYDDLNEVNKTGSCGVYRSRRVCVKCFWAYFSMIRQVDFSSVRFNYIDSGVVV